MADSTKADDIAIVLEDEIVSGAIAAGSVLRQELLSERFNVSRTPIREALRRLAALGLVSFEPNRVFGSKRGTEAQSSQSAQRLAVGVR